MIHKLATCLLTAALASAIATPSFADWGHGRSGASASPQRIEQPNAHNNIVSFHDRDNWHYGHWRHIDHKERSRWWWRTGNGWYMSGPRMAPPPPLPRIVVRERNHHDWHANKYVWNAQEPHYRH